MSGETRFAFYSSVTGSTLPASSIGSGSIETYHLSASAVTPAKADLTQTWNFTGGLQVNGVAVGASGSSYTADETTLTLSGSTFSVKNGGITSVQIGNAAVTGSNLDAATFTNGLAKIFDTGLLQTISVGYDDTSIVVESDGVHDGTVVRVKSGGIQTTHLSESAVTPAKADLTADWSFVSGSLRVATPVSNSHATPKSYVLSAISESIGGGATANAAKGAVRAVLVGDDETVALYAYDSGGKTLTFQGNVNLNNFEIGGVTDFAADDRVLFSVPAEAACFTASGSWSGIYTITNVGAYGPSGSAPVLTRASDFDSTSEITPGSFVFANSGNPDSNVPEIWYLATSGSITLDSTPLLFASASFSVTGSGGGTTYTGSNTIQIDGSAISVKKGSIDPSYLSSSVAGNGLTGGGGPSLSVNVDGATIQITNNTLTLATGSVGATQLSSSAAGNGLTLSTGLQVLVDPIFQNPLVVSVSGTSVREASATQSGYMTTKSYTQLASVVSYSSPPVTAGPIGTAVTTSNTETAAFNVGVVPANTIWTVKFTSFSIDTAEAANLINTVGAFSIYRSGSNNVTQVGATEIEHSFVSGAFTSVTMSLGLAQGQPGNADFVIQGINTYNIKHWAKFQITEFVYA